MKFYIGTKNVFTKLKNKIVQLKYIVLYWHKWEDHSEKTWQEVSTKTWAEMRYERNEV